MNKLFANLPKYKENSKVSVGIKFGEKCIDILCIGFINVND